MTNKVYFTYKLEDAIVDGRLLMITYRGSHSDYSDTQMKLIVETTINDNLKSISMADIFAIRFIECGTYYILKNRFGEKDVLVDKEKIVDYIVENYD